MERKIYFFPLNQMDLARVLQMRIWSGAEEGTGFNG
jgi:hypothetical protein